MLAAEWVAIVGGVEQEVVEEVDRGPLVDVRVVHHDHVNVVAHVTPPGD
jgi:hypothetical protein